MVWSNNCFCELIQIDQGNSNYKITAASDKDYQLLPMVSGSLRVQRLLPPLKLVAMI